MMLRNVGRRFVFASPSALVAGAHAVIWPAPTMVGSLSSRRHQSQGSAGQIHSWIEGELQPNSSVQHNRKKFIPATAAHFVKARIQQERRDIGLPEVVDWEAFAEEAVYINSKSGPFWVGRDDPRCAKYVTRQEKLKVKPMQLTRKQPQRDAAKDLEAHPLRSYFSTPSDMNDPLSIADGLAKAGYIKSADVKFMAANMKWNPRPPIVAIMGHVDHGKTTLLDYLRKSNVAAGEAGGITQSIGAFRVPVGPPEVDAKGTAKQYHITFVDTPGHAAFKEMRESGARATDLVLLIVSAVDGVQPTTLECLNLIRENHLPFIVVFTKIDRQEDVKPHLDALRALNVELEEDGGDTMWVGVSGITGQNVPELLEMIQLQTSILELATPQQARAEVLVIDSHNKDKNAVAGIVRCGTLRTGMTLAAGTTFAVVSQLRDELGTSVIKQADVCQPVLISGFKVLPKPGTVLFQLQNEAHGNRFYELMREVYKVEGNRENYLQTLNMERQGKIYDRKPDNNETMVFNYTPFNLVVKASSFGQLQAVMRLLYQIPALEGVQLMIKGAEVGGIDDHDVVALMGRQQPGGILVFGEVKDCNRFSVPEFVETHYCKVVYHGVEWVKEKLVALMPPVIQERVVAEAKVKQTFRASQAGEGNAAGLEVTKGPLMAEDGAVVFRAKPGEAEPTHKVYDGDIKELRRFRESVPSVDQGLECGMILSNGFQFRVGDVVKQIKKDVIARDVAATIAAAMDEEERRRKIRQSEEAGEVPDAESLIAADSADAEHGNDSDSPKKRVALHSNAV